MKILHQSALSNYTNNLVLFRFKRSIVLRQNKKKIFKLFGLPRILTKFYFILPLILNVKIMVIMRFFLLKNFHLR